MDMAIIRGRTEHNPAEETTPKLRRYGRSALLAGDGVAHNNFIVIQVFDKDATVAAIE